MGSTREDRLRQTTCPNCQRLSLVLAAFCSGCGSRLKSVTVPSRQAEHPLVDEPTQWVERWRSAAPATSVAPVLYRNLLVTVGRDGTLECRSPASPEPLWDLKLPSVGQPVLVAPVLIGNHLFVQAGSSMFTVDLADRTLATEQSPLLREEPVDAPLLSDLCSNGRLLAAAVGGARPAVVCWKGDSTGIKELWRHPLPSHQEMWHGLVFSSDSLIVGGRTGILEALDLRTGEPRVSQMLPQALATTPLLVRQELLLAATEEGSLLAFEPGRELACRCLAEHQELPIHGLGASSQLFCLSQGKQMLWGELAGGSTDTLRFPQDHVLSEALVMGGVTLALSREGTLFLLQRRGRDLRPLHQHKVFQKEGQAVALRACPGTLYVTGDWGEVVAMGLTS